MNKIERQNRIKRLIQSGHIGTQEEIKRHLQEEGIKALKRPCHVTFVKLDC